VRIVVVVVLSHSQAALTRMTAVASRQPAISKFRRNLVHIMKFRSEARTED
jgi:hypothetical protein